MKNDLEGFPEEIINAMLDEQERQGNKRDIEVFKRNIRAFNNGFNWMESKDGHSLWGAIIEDKDFDLFFKKYPKGKANHVNDALPYASGYVHYKPTTEQERDELVQKLQAMEFKQQYTTEEVIILLQQHNDWRRDDHGIVPMLNPTVIGEVIDEAIKQLKQIK